MPRLVSYLTGEQWKSEGPQTPAQRLFAKYASTVDNKVYPDGGGGMFYSQDVVFHNTNNAEYHGAEQMWEW